MESFTSVRERKQWRENKNIPQKNEFLENENGKAEMSWVWQREINATKHRKYP